MRYLCEKYQLDEQWYPRKDLKRQAKINEYLDMHHTSTRKCSYLIFNTLFGPKVGIIDPTFKEDYAKKLVHSALKYIDTKIL